VDRSSRLAPAPGTPWGRSGPQGIHWHARARARTQGCGRSALGGRL